MKDYVHARPGPGRGAGRACGSKKLAARKRKAAKEQMCSRRATGPRRSGTTARLDTGKMALTWVGVAGFEPAASSSRTKRAAKLRYTPLTVPEKSS
jgi:hypothetical protein